MRFSTQYAELLCNRFYIRYNNTINLKILCKNCQKNYTKVPASVDNNTYIRLQTEYICEKCSETENNERPCICCYDHE